MQRVAARIAADPFFVTGDFNAPEDNLTTHFMKGLAPVGETANPLPLLDSFRVAHPNEPFATSGTMHLFAGNTDGPKIDYVYVEPTQGVLEAEIIHLNEAGSYPSDHFPVRATLTLPEQSD
jgi:endonuclease/exonuclease/phosphatase family metal-dependent hydrolase